jgi:hypothetical protein
MAVRRGELKSGGLPGLFLFQCHRYSSVCRQAHLLSFDIGDQTQIYEMMVAFVAAFAAISLCKLNPAVFDAVDCSHMNSICADYLHMLLHATVAHFILLAPQPDKSRTALLVSGSQYFLREAIGYGSLKISPGSVKTVA